MRQNETRGPGPRSEEAARGPDINIGVLPALSPEAGREPMHAFAERLARDARDALRQAAPARWIFHFEEPVRLADDDPRRPSDFLDEASLRMVEGPYDLVVVLTDVGLVSRRHRVVPGLVSPSSRVAVLSTRKLVSTPRGRPIRSLEDEATRWNAATLLVHLIGHLLGLEHHPRGEDVMAPYAFADSRRSVPGFDPHCRNCLRRRLAGFPEREQIGGGLLRSLLFHLSSAMRHAGQVVRPLRRNRAPLLPLALPSLATAAVVPTLILVFTAEIWDVGLGMTDRVAWTFALGSILIATWYLTEVQNLFFPHQEKRLITEHMAVMNATILLTMLLAMLGLFAMTALLMLLVETYVFPPQLMSTWPTLELDDRVTLLEKVRLAVFISTIGVLTGALAGGLESRAVIRHLALFDDEP